MAQLLQPSPTMSTPSSVPHRHHRRAPPPFRARPPTLGSPSTSILYPESTEEHLSTREWAHTAAFMVAKGQWLQRREVWDLEALEPMETGLHMVEWLWRIPGDTGCRYGRHGKGWGGMGGVWWVRYAHEIQNNPIANTNLESTDSKHLRLSYIPASKTFFRPRTDAESPFMATHSSFFAKVGPVADQLGHRESTRGGLREYWGSMRKGWRRMLSPGRPFNRALVG